jgi:crotonobetainyl-CoA:carnitine CoA-transferase CaiB-like acyl-CoA transferase
MTELIAAARDGAVATVVLNRPQEQNALTQAMWTLLGEAIEKPAATPTAVTRPAPLLGQHTREVLSESGYSDAAIDTLIAEGVAAQAT